MTYLQFHIVFTIPLFAAALLANRRSGFAFSKKGISAGAVLVLLSLLYTTPWDSYLIQQAIWTYQPNSVIATLLHIPLEEYFFFIIQTAIGSLAIAFFISSQKKPSQTTELNIRPYRTLLLIFALALLAAAFFLLPITDNLRYLRLVIVWALPVLMVQWFIGWNILVKYRYQLISVITGLTLYFWAADSVAIALSVWTFPPETISNWRILGILPVEEALFFAVTNTMVVQGYLLFVKADLSKTKWRITRTASK